jgi:signal transduction histidine kinase
MINALQAMPDGGVIRIRAMSQSRLVVVYFDDEGQGVNEEDMEKILDPFFTTKPKGTGLGLGIVKNIIEAHKGKLRVENRSAGGLRVEVRLPAVAKAAAGQDQHRG